MKISWLFKDGCVTAMGTVALGLVGVSLIAYPLLLADSFFLGALSFVMGCALLGFAAASNNAASIGLKPFSNDPLNWRTAKKSYEQEVTPQSDDSEKR
jgi:hypothetical protein